MDPCEEPLYRAGEGMGGSVSGLVTRDATCVMIGNKKKILIVAD